MMSVLSVLILAFATTSDDSGWSKESIVRQGTERIVRFQARVDGGYLIVRATHEEGWHTYAMDNELRADEALQGKTSLGVEQGIDVRVIRGLELDDRWRQTAPHDFSKPELRWFTYGFDQTALFACRLNKVTGDPIRLRIKGQACREDTCCQVDLEIDLEASDVIAGDATAFRDKQLEARLQELVPVKRKDVDVSEPSSDQ